MSRRTSLIIAGCVVLFGILAQYPLQERISRYRNTLRVTMYADAEDQHITAIEDKMRELGLEPGRTTATDKQGHAAPQLYAQVPRSEWGGTYGKYLLALHGAQRVDHVSPGLNEQGIPLDQVQTLNIQDVGIIVMAALIGGFRKSAANVLWLQNEENWHSDRGYRTVPLARAVTLLDPYFTEAWVLTCWHLAYNMSVEASSPDEAAELIGTGLKFAQDGLPWNSTRFELYQEIGWTYYDKLQNYEMAAHYLKQAIAHPHPTYLERLIAHAYERIPDIGQALTWYNISLEKYGKDNVALGAITTITERYLNAWKLYEQGKYTEALVQLDEDWAKAVAKLGGNEPTKTIYWHFKARIYEQLAEQPGADRDTLYRQAFDIWFEAAQNNATDRLARRRVLILADNFPAWRDEVPPGFNDVGLPESAGQQLAPEHGSGRGTAPEGTEGDEGAVDPHAGHNH